ncbi:MAG: hypothetical protein EOP04_25660 [Proteobacteria bacterium]|nr:MAG: hypothetical protein EOP04_25660 [Pseudomonadota bacterium]
MDFSIRRCGECNKRGFSLVNVHGVWHRPWKDFPSVFMTEDFHVWRCNHCQAEASAAGSGAETDAVIEKSLRNQTSQFLEIIKSRSGLSYEEIGKRIGITAPYISNLRGQKKTPSFSVWSMLKLCAKHPEMLKEVLDPDYDIEKENILLRHV